MTTCSQKPRLSCGGSPDRAGAPQLGTQGAHLQHPLVSRDHQPHEAINSPLSRDVLQYLSQTFPRALSRERDRRARAWHCNSLVTSVALSMLPDLRIPSSALLCTAAAPGTANYTSAVSSMCPHLTSLHFPKTVSLLCRFSSLDPKRVPRLCSVASSLEFLNT